MNRRQACAWLGLFTAIFAIAEVLVQPAKAQAPVRALWVWNTSGLLNRDGEREQFLRSVERDGFTDVFLYLRARDYVTHEHPLKLLLAGLQASGVRAFGMEGWRGYFSDVDGPAGLYAAADAMIAFNRRCDARFAGFHSDLEPHDGQGEGRIRFHNGIAQSRLTKAQLADRDGLMSEWLSIHAALRSRMQAASLIYSAALPSWLDDYEGEAVTVPTDSVRKGVMQQLMELVQDYVIMSYNTDPANVMRRIEGELAYADTLGAAAPRILFALETHRGPGLRVSYGDTPGKASRSAVRADYEVISRAAARHRTFAGGAIHDWEGWRDLPEGAAQGAAGESR